MDAAMEQEKYRKNSGCDDSLERQAPISRKPMQLTCPVCAAEYPIEAGYTDADGKRLAALFAEFEPALGRAVIAYLRLFKPPKNALRTARAAAIVQQLLELVRPGTVCRDERGGVRRPAPPPIWLAAMEQMLADRGKLTLPLGNHHYLRAVAFGLADSADAARERQKEADLRVGKHRPAEPAKPDPLREKLAWLRQQLEYGQITQNDYDEQMRALRAKDKQ
jgi:hypothetical protein